MGMLHDNADFGNIDEESEPSLKPDESSHSESENSQSQINYAQLT